MNLYAKIIFLYFKKQFTFREIVDFLSEELQMENVREAIPGRWIANYTPLGVVHQVIGNEVAEHYRQGEYSKFINKDPAKKFNEIHNQKLDEYKHQKVS